MSTGDTAFRASTVLPEGTGVTIGVEEEFLLIRRGSPLAVGNAAALPAGVLPADLADGSSAARELWDTEVETSWRESWISTSGR